VTDYANLAFGYAYLSLKKQKPVGYNNAKANALPFNKSSPP
jgi:hypothetical protein